MFTPVEKSAYQLSIFDTKKAEQFSVVEHFVKLNAIICDYIPNTLSHPISKL